MSEVHATAATDPGQVRQANEDAFYLGETVFAVADGMGGHLGGEVASEMALEPLIELDGKVFADASAASDELTRIIEQANRIVSKRAAEDARYRGMGTTLTAGLIEGRRLHIGHVGDSRAYLLRDGELSQLTDDHTLVQHLVDEGQITPEEAATHPQRSIITRAIGVAPNVDVDTMSFDLEEGDVVLLCSDGLTGVVSDSQIRKAIENGTPDRATVESLIDLANRGGGPDNITVMLLRYGERPAPAAVAPAADDAEAEEDDTGELSTDELGPRRVVVRSDTGSGGGDWAQRLGRFGALGRDRDTTFEDEPSGPRRWQRWSAILVALAIVIALVVGGAQWLLSRSYYVGLDQGEVVIFQGVPAELGPFELSRVHERTELESEELPEFVVANLEDNVTAIDLGDARRIVEQYREMAAEPEDGGERSPDDTTTESSTAPGTSSP